MSLCESGSKNEVPSNEKLDVLRQPDSLDLLGSWSYRPLLYPPILSDIIWIKYSSKKRTPAAMRLIFEHDSPRVGSGIKLVAHVVCFLKRGNQRMYC